MPLTDQDEFKSLSIPLAFSNMKFVYLESSAVSDPAKATPGEPVGVLRDVEQNLTRNGRPVNPVTNQHEIFSNSKGFMASRMESMVNDLTGSGAPKPASKRSSLGQDP